MFPSLDLAETPHIGWKPSDGVVPMDGSDSGYALHDKDGYLEFVFGMWLHTAHLVGKPTIREVVALTPRWPLSRRHQLIELLTKRGQVRA